MITRRTKYYELARFDLDKGITPIELFITKKGIYIKKDKVVKNG